MTLAITPRSWPGRWAVLRLDLSSQGCSRQESNPHEGESTGCGDRFAVRTESTSGYAKGIAFRTVPRSRFIGHRNAGNGSEGAGGHAARTGVSARRALGSRAGMICGDPTATWCPVTVKPSTLGWGPATSLGSLLTRRDHLPGQPPTGTSFR